MDSDDEGPPLATPLSDDGEDWLLLPLVPQADRSSALTRPRAPSRPAGDAPLLAPLAPDAAAPPAPGGQQQGPVPVTLITGFLGAGKVRRRRLLGSEGGGAAGECARARRAPLASHQRATSQQPPNCNSLSTHRFLQTTLVRHILTARHGARIAVILNEFGGEGDIEAAFVRDEGGGSAAVPEWVELANGCLCCSVKAEFLQVGVYCSSLCPAQQLPGV